MMSFQDLLCTTSHLWVLRDSSRMIPQAHSAAAKRNRAFALFETATLRHDIASKGRWRATSSEHEKKAQRLLEHISGGEIDVGNIVEQATKTGHGFEVIPTADFVEKITAFNIGHENASSVDRQAAAKITTDRSIETHSELNDHDRIRQSLMILHEHLQNLRTNEGTICNAEHDIMLRMTGFEEISAATAVQTIPFEILLSPCQNAPGRENTATWQATSVTFDSMSRHKSIEKWREAICGLNELGNMNGHPPKLVFDQQHLCLSCDQRDEESRPLLLDKHIPLRDLLNGKHCSNSAGDNLMAFSREDRGILTLNLARSLFYLFDGPWIRSSGSYTTDDFIFVGNCQSTLTVLNGCHKPYIRSSLSHRDDARCGKSKNKLRSDRPSYRIFFGLAQILMEIHLGRSLDIDKSIPGSFRASLKEIARRELKDPEHTAYKEAILGCLDLAFKLLPIRTEQLSLKERQFIHDDVIANLKEHCKVWEFSGPENLKLMKPSDDEPGTKESAHTTVKAMRCLGDVEGRIFSEDLKDSRTCRPPPGLSVFTLYDDMDPGTQSTKDAADKFMDRIKAINKQYIIPCEHIINARKKVKIAILDSGVSCNDSLVKGAFQEGIIQGGWGPTGTDRKDYDDTYGHGTHVTRLLLATAPLAEIYIAKVCDDKFLDESKTHNIVRAFEWALGDPINVDIISISFGMQKNVSQIESVIERALERKKLIFAAAANDGGANPRAFPACLPGVICIHACDGLGNRADFSPWPLVKADNFHTIGVSLKSYWDDQSGKDETVFKSGTSFATPIAAGIAANVMEFASAHLAGPYDRPKELFEYPSMRELLRGISREFGALGYQFIKPWNLFTPIDSNDEHEPRASYDRATKGLRHFLRSRQCPDSWSR